MLFSSSFFFIGETNGLDESIKWDLLFFLSMTLILGLLCSKYLYVCIKKLPKGTDTLIQQHTSAY